MPAPEPVDPFPRAIIRVGLLLAILLMIGAAVAFYYASQVSDKARHSGEAIEVAIHAKSCEPNELTVPAGRTTFKIINKSDRTVEWEILDGVMVVEERENIAPGFTQTISAKLEAGEYQITCGLLSNPRGRLIVTPSATVDADNSKPKLTAFIGALAEYQVYLTRETAALVQATSALTAAVKAHDLNTARNLYAPARAVYARIAPASEAFADLDAAIDARADYFEKREADPAFGGLHRIEYGLFQQNSTDGLDQVADKLDRDVATLQARIRELRIFPGRMLAGASAVLNRFASAGQGEDRYAHTDLQSLAGTFAGVSKIIDLMRPVAIKADETAVTAIDSDATALKASLEALRDGAAFKAYNTLSADVQAKLKSDATALADKLTKLRDDLELN